MPLSISGHPYFVEVKYETCLFLLFTEIAPNLIYMKFCYFLAQFEYNASYLPHLVLQCLWISPTLFHTTLILECHEYK